MADDDLDQETWSSIRLSKRVRLKIGEIAQRENRKITDQIRQFIYEGIERRERQQQDE
jgi:predicted transcriptional regulator